MIQLSMLDTSALTATLHLMAWSNVGVAVALVVGAVLWLVWCERESRHHPM